MAIAACAAGVLGLAAAPASAAGLDQSETASPNVNLTHQQEEFVTSKLTQYGASKVQAEELVADFEAGVPWQSAGGFSPTSVTTEVVDGFPYNVEHFADGSYVASGIAPAPVSGVQPMSVAGCSTTGMSAGVSYGTHCLIKYETATASAQFRASYSIWSTGQDIYDYGDG